MTLEPLMSELRDVNEASTHSTKRATMIAAISSGYLLLHPALQPNAVGTV